MTRVKRGLEVDYSPRYANEVADFVNKMQWDILLCSVHEFTDGSDIERKVGRTQSSEGARWEDYFQLQRIALESDFIPFQVLAHPIRISRGGGEAPQDIDELLFNLAMTAKKNGRALELNGNDIGSNPRLVRQLATACARVGCPVSLGSDAHYPRDVFRNLDSALGLANELRLETV